MKSIVELSNISCQSKYIQIDSFCNGISPRNRFSQPHMTLPPITENRLDGADGSFWKCICITFFFGFLPAEVLNGFCRFETFFAAPGGVCGFTLISSFVSRSRGYAAFASIRALPPSPTLFSEFAFFCFLHIFHISLWRALCLYPCDFLSVDGCVFYCFRVCTLYLTSGGMPSYALAICYWPVPLLHWMLTGMVDWLRPIFLAVHGLCNLRTGPNILYMGP